MEKAVTSPAVGIRYLAPAAGAATLLDPLVESWIMAGIDAGEIALDYEAIQHGVLCGDLTTVEIYLDGELRAVVICEVCEVAGKRTLSILTAGGTNAAAWCGAMHDATMQVARETGCVRMVILGRPGWRRLMRPHGWREAATFIEVQTQQLH